MPIRTRAAKKVEPELELPRPRGPRYTIGQLMIVIAAASVLLSIPEWWSPLLVWFAILGPTFLPLLITANTMIEWSLGRRCPVCSRRALRRLARHPRYYRCRACHARLKRTRFGPWCDASGLKDDFRFRSQSGNWRGYVPPVEGDDSTGGILLEGKRSLDLATEARQKHHSPAPSSRSLEAARLKVQRFVASRHPTDAE